MLQELKQAQGKLAEVAETLKKASDHLDELVLNHSLERPLPIPRSAPEDLRAAPAVRSTAPFGDGSPRD